jgi:hypothetical protein
MAAGKINFDIEQNADFNRIITITDSTPAQNKIDLSGCTFESKAKQNSTVDEVLFEFAIVPIDLQQGKFRLNVDHSTLSIVTVPKGEYDLLITYASGEVDRVLEGNITFSKGVS